MANLKEIRNRIASVSSTMQITSAMKMVSAAKLKKAQDAITAMRPYSDKLSELLQNLSASLDADSGSKFADNRPVKKVLIVAITSNRGLCGAFNTNILKQSALLARETYADKQVDFVAIGKKANDILKKKNKVIANHSSVYDDLTFDNVAVIAEELMDLFTTGAYDKIEIVYNKFKNAATQIVMTEQFLPIVPVEGEANLAADYIFEPSKAGIVEQLIPKSLKTQLYKGVRDSFASEHGARMTAMHKATDNATDLRNQLKLTYNKARQAAITGEILEIVGGAEALNN
ncbi:MULTISPECIES: ATP synthase F1 subunit gamma [unclassified Arenibacter]|jgi:F-type H+-transporting ATPase subunit gamma|uniref:ATP synthase F1 subunit gamma n=1 Tax=unclassified Arenibacter TaxID=2615047 RepID=UPI000E3557B3|nr:MULTISPECIES: ATP synthase F1 subunit gamma [unclassified Arenibacter]MCM4161998.1 ATP synthase F1 subunit gamma [Arenibacter sp. A80]RFT57626.1 ATP synthase F1 subunit gamma [Arenibacter sp. P308M17]